MRNFFTKRLLKYVLLETLIGIVIGALFLLYSSNYTLVGFIDALTVSTILLFAVGWFLFISNEHLLDMLFYGVASFGKAIVGKKMKNSYYDHIQNKDQVDKIVYWSFWFTSFIFAVAIAISFILYLN